MPQLKCLVLILFLLAIPQTVLGQDTFRFAVFSDSRGDRSTSECAADNYGVSPLLEIVRDHLLRVNESNAVSLVVFPGDMISGMLKRDAQSTAACNRIQLEHWRKTIKPIMDRGILIRVTTGNHDAASVDLTRGVTRCGDHGWPYTPNRENFEVVRNLVGDMILGAPGPASDLGMTYSFDAGGCHFAVLAAYTMFENNSFSNETLKWLDSDLAQARRAGLKLFVASHPPAFPGGGHMWNSLSFFDPSYTCNDYSGIDRRKERDRFWNILKKHKVVAYLCGHEHNIQIQNVEECWHVVSAGLTEKLYPLNGSPKDTQRNQILYDRAWQNPRASTIWPWNDGQQTLWGWCLITVQGTRITLDVYGSSHKPESVEDLRKLKTFVLQE